METTAAKNSTTMNNQPIKIVLSPADADAFEKRKQAPDSMFYAAGQREKERILAAAFAEAGVNRDAAEWDYTLETRTINIFPAKAPLTIILALELCGRRERTTKQFTHQIMARVDSTLESLTPYELLKTSEGRVLSRTVCTSAQYDPQARTLQVQHSLPKSKAYGFIYDLEQGHGFKEQRQA